MWRARQHRGFTIVELLIVIVVIAILAAITIVAYNGVTQKANASVAQNNASEVEKKLKLYAVENGDAYPADLSSIGLVSGDSTTYQYTPGSAGYCVTTTTKGTSYYVAYGFTYTNANGTTTINQTTPASGACPGHAGGSSTAIRNLVINPSAEGNSDTYAGPNGSTFARSTVRARFGTYSIVATLPNGYSYSNVGVRVYTIGSINGNLKPHTQYTASAYGYVPTGTVDVQLSVQGAARASADDLTNRATSLKDQWQRVSYVFTTGASGDLSVYMLNAATTTTAGTQFWTDGFMITEGNTLYSYADGNSGGWVWDGAAGNSMSRGPAL